MKVTWDQALSWRVGAQLLREPSGPSGPAPGSRPSRCGPCCGRAGSWSRPGPCEERCTCCPPTSCPRGSPPYGPRSSRRAAGISRKAGWITPALLVDGHVAGVWSHERRGEAVAVGIEAFAPLSRRTRAAAEAHARSYETLVAAPVTVTWLEG